MKSVLRLLVLAAAVFAPALALAAQRGDNEIQSVAAGNNAFAMDLYQRLASQKGNLFFSPYSIDTALAMAYAGARGLTAQQMADVLHFAVPLDKLNEAYGRMIADLNAGGQRGQQTLYQLVIANAMWAQKGYPFDEKYQELLTKNYGAGLMAVDFQRAAEQARQQINEWVAKQTKDKIKDLIPQGVLTHLTRLVLTNAIYFKSSWESTFNKSATKEEPFQLGDGQTKNVPLMTQQRRFRYFENDQLQALELPYNGGALSMIVLLPRKVDALTDLEKSLTTESLSKWLDGMNARLVRVYFPKFKMEARFSLPKVLQSMGMIDAFSDTKADFSGIATVDKLYITDVIHKAYIDVNEEGTEAAAATAVVIGVRSAMPRPEEPVVFRADHPFVFAIRHRATGTVLFMGRVVNP